ncbi:hypothetical protein VHEMI09930 [[Torrubiella] hemipterigena]|uniref:Ubiquitination network signaling protein n=1 Tax=[Torrubiella] hemipterigena TaxID=1531966 RepID=A0A0A1TR73_9HYPO|nr:hypothetical protein VHEMI09930 [[Torrubiella] hemipterigena]
MARASGSSKRHSGGAVQRDQRHDNSSSSGKRSSRKSHGSSQGNHKADHGSAISAAAQAKLHSDASLEHGANNNLVRRYSLDGISETSSDSANSHQAANGSVDDSHRQIDVNAFKNVDVHRDSGPLQFAATVLRTLPLQDTLAILIILMHVPSLSLSAIYAIFTCLTFVPPVTTSSGMNINIAELFESSTTAPSLVTLWCMDLFFLLIWLFLWEPLQDVVLDLAKPIIAITLGGGAGSRNGSPRGLFTCFFFVIVHHIIRGTKAYWSKLAPYIPPTWSAALSFGKDFSISTEPYPAERDTYFWLQSGLAVHILTQGIIRYIRDWYLRRERASAIVNGTESETNKHNTSSSSTAGEGAQENGHAAHDTDVVTAHAASVVSAKKKRKQSAQVRLQQPLWAALASTKIVVVKEYELSESVSDSLNANAVDIHNLGNAPFDKTPGKIWISYVGAEEVSFSTSHFPKANTQVMWAQAGGETNPDKLRPFYVRVNNAPWQLTRINPVNISQGEISVGYQTQWTGDIYGLRPCSRYVIEFADSRTDEVIFSASIRTVKESIRSKDGSAPILPDPPVVHDPQPLEPDSPIVTVRTSIEAAQQRLAEERNKLKALRRDQKARFNALKKDVDGAENMYSSAGNSDDKLRAKIRQQETTKSHYEREIKEITNQLKHFDAEPELSDRKKKAERAFAAEKKLFETAQKNFNAYKTKLDNEIKERELDQTNLNSKRNKIATRIAKVDSEIVNLTDANNRGINEAERRNQERVSFVNNNSAIEKNYAERIAVVSAENVTKAENVQALQQQVEAARSYMTNGAVLDTAEAQGYQGSPGGWSGSNGGVAMSSYPASYWGQTTTSGDLIPTIAPSHVPGLSPWNAAPHQHQHTVQTKRDRSASMLSDGSRGSHSSGDSMNAPFYKSQPQMARMQALFHNGRGSGSSGSGSGHGSIGPDSPI